MSVLWKKDQGKGEVEREMPRRELPPALSFGSTNWQRRLHTWLGRNEANWQPATRACWAPTARGTPRSQEAPARRQARLQTWPGALGMLKEHLDTTVPVKPYYYCLLVLETGRLRPRGVKSLAPSQQLAAGGPARFPGPLGTLPSLESEG